MIYGKLRPSPYSILPHELTRLAIDGKDTSHARWAVRVPYRPKARQWFQYL